MNNKVLVVGTGLGGLATALRLAKQGFEVEMVEKNHQAGGRLNQIKKDGFTFDTGPSFFSMSYEFEEFAKDCNIRLPFDYVELDPLYSVNFIDNPKTFHLYKDIDKLSDQFSEIEPDFQEKFDRYIKKSAALFHDTVDLVIKNNFNSLAAYIFTLMRVNPVHIPVLFQSFWQHVKKYFSSKEARQIVSLVAFFLGRTPFDTMGIYSLLSYTEFKHDGYYNVKGGMYKIVEGLVQELKKEKVTIHYNTEIKDFNKENGTLVSLTDQNKQIWKADIFVINADAAWFRGKIFRQKKYSEPKLDKMNWTMGYLTFYLGIKCKLPQVDHHNYYLGSNFEEYAHNVLKNPDTLQKPYYYVNVLSKHNKECAPEGCESLFFVCPVPNLKIKSDWSDKDEIVNSIIADFSKRIKMNIQPEIISKTIYTPEVWQNKFNLYRGSGLGLSHNMKQIGALRPANFDENLKNTFYVGASTIPGAGLPMAIISSKLTFERIVKLQNKR
ncbi:phytoene desaturase family protein [Maribellus maritimus]|uniref:phytoene desaturase family protein n=1 Tax=Maribellus maritimus TaxID=2870838 RepID=UPI001EEB4334|nr:phytoene desaturase family protein [Maribellus maritimus]MCG6189189.1 phytoene desaturase [Maribellus maritimus]